MKSIFLFLGILAHCFVFSQTKDYQSYDPAADAANVMEGQGWPGMMKDFYDRLPAGAEQKVRKAVWDLSKNSAGLQLHFASDAPEIIVKYTVTGNLQMPHMPATGVSGVDLYAKAEKNHWLWAAGKFSFGDTIVYRFSHLSAINREYVLYLPLYNTVKWMQISVPKENRFTPLPTRKEKPVVVYGTSIAQGACASRPGLAWTNILGRLLNVPVINLGFSGNGRLEPELIELLTQIDASVYVLDCLPNLTSGYISNSELKQRIVNAIKQLRSKKPFTPILLTEHDGYSDGEINSVRYNEYTAVNKTLDEMVDSLTRKGFQQIYLLKKDAINQDIETMVDGTHPNDMGMMRYADAYEKKLKGILKKESHVLSQPPSLIPLPQQLKWDEGFFDLSKCAAIVVKHPLLKKEALYIQNELKKKGFSITVTEKRPLNRLAFEMIINAEDTLSSEEGYHLKVDAQKIQLTAKKAHGIFNGLQTFLQLISKGGQVKACEITDWPQFGWRGYMVDVGRNYQSMALLKQQIDIMSHYKLNIFHLHLTEDIAWRLEVPGYPALTAPQNMERNKGMYYSVAELKELIRYCNDRYITLVPEIDMPGHSAAFQRALGVPMQSAEGLQIIKKILTSICTTYDVPYLHLGGDEVTITYAPFLPAVTQLVESLGKKVIGWDPGGRMGSHVLRQLWMREGPKDSATQYIDSRHLYLNHMDPLESVVTIFCRRIGDVTQETTQVKGGTLCLWNDRNVAREEDLLRQNPVYPAMIAFAERIWQGGGWKGWVTNLQPNNSEQVQAFSAFEQRLMDHRQQYFEHLPFPYVAQSKMTWKLYGPYPNEGNLQEAFGPETGNFSTSKSTLEVIGGTVILRHFWHPLVKGVLSEPQENTTWYAVRQLWSDVDTTTLFWIGFNNLSRSYNTDTPMSGTWNDWGSQVLINGKLIASPNWGRAGRKGASEVPLLDEGYEYRSPVAIPLHQGWNTIMMKLPVGSFKGKDGQNPIKWMGTVVPITELRNER